MKILRLTIILLVTSTILFFSTGCWKENLTKDFIGKYSGMATEDKVFITGPSSESFPNCKVTIEKATNISIWVTTHTDTTNPYLEQEYNVPLKDDNTFSFRTKPSGAWKSTASFEGKLQGNFLDFRFTRSDTSGLKWSLVFHGQKN